MKLLLLLTLSLNLLCLMVQAKESITPLVAEKFGEVFDVTVEFVEKPNEYHAQTIVEAKWYAKVKAVNGKTLKEPIVMEYRSDDQSFQKGSTMTLRAYEDIESTGINSEWDGEKLRQFPYYINRFLCVRILDKSEHTQTEQNATRAESKPESSEKPRHAEKR